MNTETETKSTARNVVFLLRGKDGNEQLVKTFRAGDKVGEKVYKSPKRALTNYLEQVAADEKHELHTALLDGELKQAAGHPKPVSLTTKSVVS